MRGVDGARRARAGKYERTMSATIDHYSAEAMLRRSGSSWTASQSHGLLCGRLCVLGADGVSDWLGQVLEESDPANALAAEGASQLGELAENTYRQLAERQSEFEPLMPDESEPLGTITQALAEWCEGFLHGLVTNVQAQSLKDKLAAEPISSIIKDMLEISRAEAGDDEGESGDEEALTELIEYLRVTTQLVYEELSAMRHAATQSGQPPGSESIH